WHRGLSSAIDAYGEMLVMAAEAMEKSLELNRRDKLAEICPPCFGPSVGPLPLGEPNHIVCLDGNFQHQRHLTSSIENGGLITPSLFLDIDGVEGFQTKMGQGVNAGTNPGLCRDPCAARHTAADDSRRKSHWKGCDKTGLMGVGCRHDQCLMFISIIQSGEK
ncbi:hypothetical protein DFH28DRAFT_882772, partial [Melampsora americana]